MKKKFNINIYKLYMPALTHGRVKNGFNGPNRKLLVNKCPAGDLVVKRLRSRRCTT